MPITLDFSIFYTIAFSKFWAVNNLDGMLVIKISGTTILDAVEEILSCETEVIY